MALEQHCHPYNENTHEKQLRTGNKATLGGQKKLRKKGGGNRLLQGGISVFIALLFVKCFGLLLQIGIACVFGASAASDAFLTAFSIPNILLAGIIAAAGNVYIPLYQKQLNIDKKHLKQFNGNITALLTLIGIAMAVLLALFPQVGISLFASGLEKKSFQTACILLRIMAVVSIPITIQSIFNGYLQIKGKFFLSSVAPALVNLPILAALFFASKHQEVTSLAYGTVIGYLLSAAVLWIGCLRSDFPFRPYFNLKCGYMRSFFSLFFPIYLSIMVSQLNTMIDRNFASTLVAGTVSALIYADKINEAIGRICISPVTTVIYPELSKCAANHDKEKLKKYLSESMTMVFLIMLPVSAALFCFSGPLVNILFRRGQFNEQAVQITSEYLKFLAIGFSFPHVSNLLELVCYSLNDGKIPMVNSLLALGINIILNFLLIGPLKHIGLAVATSVSGIVTTVLLIFSLHRKIGTFVLPDFRKDLLKMIAATGLMCAVCLPVYRLLQPQISGNLSFLICAVIGILVYSVCMQNMKVSIWKRYITSCLHKIKKDVKQ
ncbi:MAG: murein biosynthesis integral membrane protein MurJ [Oscillospiraceae bacterium]|jgi:putative peptidoglycan lipid II flippase|nr:murein biosynthesis integral membrane protein MurJ [Oscillospiraceae bacterium]